MTETPVINPFRIFLFAIGSTAFFACMNLFVKLSSETHSIGQILFFRSLIGLVPILFLMLRHHDRSIFKTQRHMGHFWRGVIGIISMACFFLSFAMLPLTTATSLHFASPLILTALAIPLLGEKVGIHRWGAIFVGFLGILFMFHPEGDTNVPGSVIALSAAFLGALAMINVRKLGSTEHALTIVFYFSLYGIAAGAVAMMFDWRAPTMESMIYLIMTGLLGGIGQIFLTFAYSKGPAAYVSAFSYLTIVFSAVFDILIWQIHPDWRVVVGSLVIMSTGLYILFRETRKKVEVVATDIYAAQPDQPTEKDIKDPIP